MLTDSQKWLTFVILVGVGWLIYLLSPILTPFLVAALFAYLADPVVDRLEERNISRTPAVIVVSLALVMLIAVVVVLLVPIFESQLAAFVRVLPEYIEWGLERLIWLENRLGTDASLLEVDELKKTLLSHWQEAGSFAAKAITYLSRSGMVLMGWIASLIIIPVVTFYMLRDWDALMTGIRDLLPRSIEPLVCELARESDEVLSAFLRGQFLVMLTLGTIYSVGLWIVGLKLALIIGLLAGLISFVPYLGLIVGIVVAGGAILFQTQDVFQLIPVGIVFAVGQVIEAAVLTPLLVGDRVGLHPVTVIFAILAGGQLFGFIGVLLALPTAAVAAVLARRLRRSYKSSALYGHRPAAQDPIKEQCGRCGKQE